MVPSFKFTLIGWAAIIGLGLLSIFFKDKKEIARSHLSNTSKSLTRSNKATLPANQEFNDKILTFPALIVVR